MTVNFEVQMCSTIHANIRVVCSAYLVCLWMFTVLQTCACHEDLEKLESEHFERNSLPLEILEQLSSVGSKESIEDDCVVIPKDARLTRYSTNNGFHRDIHTSVSVLLDPTSHCTTCRLLLIETLPNGLYVDLYQVAAAVQFGGPQILAFEEIDVEKPAYLSSNHTILVYPPSPSHATSLGDDTMVNFTIGMPIHLRYHRPSPKPEAYSAHVSLPPPHLLFRCEGVSGTATPNTGEGKLTNLPQYNALCDTTSQTVCLWQLLPLDHEESKELHFDVPVGQQNHTFVVTTVTILATVVGTVAVLIVMVRSSAKDKPD